MNLRDSLESTADGAFAVDSSLKIVHWNQAAQDILGFDKSEVIGRPCYQLLQGLDEVRRPICTAFCQAARSVSRREPVASHDILALTTSGERRWLNISIMAYDDGKSDGNPFIIHLFRDSTKKKDVESFLNKVLEVAKNNHDRPQSLYREGELRHSHDDLTSRERDVLSLIVRGYGTREIAQALFISPNTVRNHVQHILQKLHVHRRADAVACAIRLGLVE